MAASVGAAAGALGVSVDEVARLRAALEVAMAARAPRLSDPHHPAYLHPGRSVLVLLRDARLTEPDALALAAVLESRDPELRASDLEVESVLGASVVQNRSSIPPRNADDAVERLVTLDGPTALAALAERLDHLRHEHLRSARTGWPELVAEVEEVWLPLARRNSEVMARRYAHWLRTFCRRL